MIFSGSDKPGHVRQAALAVLDAAEPAQKARTARAVAEWWRSGALAFDREAWSGPAPGAPSRPERPELVPPSKVKRRRLTSPAGRIALLHAVAHIEFNAIDLAFDMIARFGGSPELEGADRRDFLADWISVGDDEARHFCLIAERLAQMEASYGDLPAHNGLWDAAQATSDDIAARLAIAPLVLEARGLDVTPGMIDRLISAGDEDSAACLRVIYHEEVGHVRIGARWFLQIAKNRKQNPKDLFTQMVKSRFKGPLKAPFNREARNAAGLPEDFYAPLADSGPPLA